jgi:hypothetical protein
MGKINGVICGTVLSALLFLAGTADGAGAGKAAAFDATLRATVSKDWNTVTDSTDKGCAVSRRSVGKRVATFRSTRPTRVVVRSGSGRVSYVPAAVRFVRIEVAETGRWTDRFEPACSSRNDQGECRRVRRVVRGARLAFFRSGRNKVSFRPARLPDTRNECLRESAAVRALRLGLQQAQGELSEASFADPRIRSQTASGSAEVETDLDAEEVGRVVERVSWRLTFTRR